MGPATACFPGSCYLRLHALNAIEKVLAAKTRDVTRNILVEALIQLGDRWDFNGHGSARLAVKAAQFQSDIICIANGRSVNAKDVMSVMSLRAKKGILVHILATGPDEMAALEAIVALLNT